MHQASWIAGALEGGREPPWIRASYTHANTYEYETVTQLGEMCAPVRRLVHVMVHTKQPLNSGGRKISFNLIFAKHTSIFPRLNDVWTWYAHILSPLTPSLPQLSHTYYYFVVAFLWWFSFQLPSFVALRNSTESNRGYNLCECIPFISTNILWYAQLFARINFVFRRVSCDSHQSFIHFRTIGDCWRNCLESVEWAPWVLYCGTSSLVWYCVVQMDGLELKR